MCLYLCTHVDRVGEQDRGYASDDDKAYSMQEEDEEEDPEEEEKRLTLVSGETEHLRLLRLVRDTHVWSDGKRYSEQRAQVCVDRCSAA